MSSLLLISYCKAQCCILSDGGRIARTIKLQQLHQLSGNLSCSLNVFNLHVSFLSIYHPLIYLESSLVITVVISFMFSRSGIKLLIFRRCPANKKIFQFVMLEAGFLSVFFSLLACLMFSQRGYILNLLTSLDWTGRFSTLWVHILWKI